MNPIDIKVRSRTYDDYPDYYDHTPIAKGEDHQILGFDGSGIVESVGSSVSNLSSGDEVYWSGSPIRQGSNAEYQLVASGSVAIKPKNLDFVQAACMPLTYITAYEALVERLGIQKGEKAAVLIINGAGGVGSVASQIARTVLELPVVITTASRDETLDFSKGMGATHVINHRKELQPQIKDLNLDVPIKYVFITHTTPMYLGPATEIVAPFGKITSIVQTKDFSQYGTPMMAKSLTFVWTLLGTKPWYGVDVESHGEILSELRSLLESGKVKCHHTQTLALDVQGLRKAHEVIEGGGSIGKVGLSAEVAEKAFA